LGVAQVVDNREDSGPLGKALKTTGTDAKVADVFTVGNMPSTVVSDSGQTQLLMFDASGAGIYAVTSEPGNQDGSEVDFKFDATGQKVGIATAFLQAPASTGGP